MSFVLDASIAIGWCFSDEATSESTSLLEKLKLETAFVPSIWPLEVGNVLVVAEKRKRLKFAEISQCLEILKRLNINVDIETSDRAFHEILSLAHSEQLTTYDASYLELAMRKGIPLATKDNELGKVANRLGVKLLI